MPFTNLTPPVYRKRALWSLATLVFAGTLVALKGNTSAWSMVLAFSALDLIWNTAGWLRVRAQ
jgi:hypothetical protein